MLETGLKGYASEIVEKKHTAKKLGSGELLVYATPAVIALIEKAAWKSVISELEKGQGTVGTRLDVSHLAATPVGMTVWCETELTEVDGRRLVFSVRAFDEVGLIAEGTHERFIVLNDKFLQKADNKLPTERRKQSATKKSVKSDNYKTTSIREFDVEEYIKTSEIL